MKNNKHYFINNQTGSYLYVLNIGYNSNNQIELQSLQTSLDIFNSTNYSIPQGTTWFNDLYLYQDSTNTAATNVHINVWPGFRILNNTFSQAIGFYAGNYPSNTILLYLTSVSTSLDPKSNKWITQYEGEWLYRDCSANI